MVAPAYPSCVVLQIGTTKTFNLKTFNVFLIFYVISINGLIFGAGIFGGLICSPFDYPRHLKSGVPPWAHDLNILCLASDSDTNMFIVVS